jgi:small-conductance mechanosensitive channel
MEFQEAIVPAVVFVIVAAIFRVASWNGGRSGWSEANRRVALTEIALVGLAALLIALPIDPAYRRLAIVALAVAAVIVALPKFLDPSPRRRYRVHLWMGVVGFVGLIVFILSIPDPSRQSNLLQLTGYILGAVIALSSTTLVANALAGFMLRVIRSFAWGDYLRVGEHFGKVSERGIFHVEIQTESSDLVTIPNMFLVQNAVTVIGSPDPNAKGTCTWVSADVTLGYDEDRRQISELLKEAAAKAELETPWVRITELGDFWVGYRVTAKLPDVKGPGAANKNRILTAPSQLRAEMMDALHQGDIEIVSPTFMNTRDFPEDRKFMSKPPRASTTTVPVEEDDVDPDVFAKADKVEQIDLEREELSSEIEAVKERVKEAEDDADAKLEAEQTLGELETKAKELDSKLADPDSAVDPAAESED